MIQIISQNTTQTQKIGELLGQEVLLQTPFARHAIVIGLEGELGSGKTTFVQGLARGLKIKERILSPTFVILKKFNILSKPQGRRTAALRFLKCLYHIDCYRLNSPKDLLDLGFQEFARDSQNLIVIEWAEKIKKILPKHKIMIKFKWLSKNQRQIILNLT